MADLQGRGANYQETLRRNSVVEETRIFRKHALSGPYKIVEWNAISLILLILISHRTPKSNGFYTKFSSFGFFVSDFQIRVLLGLRDLCCGFCRRVSHPDT